MLTRAIAAALLALAAPVAAQQGAGTDCRDDRGADRCAAELQRRTRDLFGVSSIEQHRDAGDQVRRVFYVDGYGRDVVAIAFVRSPGREPTAFVHFPRRAGERRNEPLQAALPHDAWTEALWRSAHFDRSFTPRPDRQDEINICMHSWVYTIEANDPARASLQPASLRRKTEDACADGPAQIFAMEMQRLALPLFPHCARLDPGQHRNPASQLAACRLLSGDRLAAAEVMNRSRALTNARDPEDLRALAGIFASGATIEWNGVRKPNGEAAAGFWLARFREPTRPHLFLDGVEGLAADRVRMTGFLERSVEGEQGTTFQRAPVTLFWIFGPAQQFEVTSATVGPWQAYRPR